MQAHIQRPSTHAAHQSQPPRRDVAAARNRVSRKHQRSVCARVTTANTALDLKRIKLGRELEVTEVCLGTMTFGEQTDQAEAFRMLDYAADCGVNFMDTAEMYAVPPRQETQGATSTIIGNWFASGRGKRSDWVIATKVTGRTAGMEWIPANRHDSPQPPTISPRLCRKHIREGLDGELRRLRTDYVDLFQLHWPERYTPNFGRWQYDRQAALSHAANTGNGAPLESFQEQVLAVGSLIKEGKIRAWGLSNESPYGLTTFCHVADQLGVPRPVTVQNCYNLMHRIAEGSMAEALHWTGMGLLPWSTLAGGSLSGKYLPDAPKKATPDSRLHQFKERYIRFTTPRVQAAVVKYAALAKEVGLTPAQLSLAWCRTRWFIPSTIVGATSLEQLVENMDTWRLTGPEGLSPEVQARVQEIHMQQRNPGLVD